MATSTVKLNGTTLMTVNDTTAVASDVVQGKVFTAVDGSKVTGTAVESSTPAISILDTLDAAGGTIRTITALDISSDTVTATHLESGYTAHDSVGNAIIGTLIPGGGGGNATFATGTFTPTENTTSLSIDTGIDCDYFIFYTKTPSSALGSGARATYGKVEDFKEGKRIIGGDSNAGNSAWTSLGVYGNATLTKSGTVVSGTTYRLVAGVTYTWIALHLLSGAEGPIPTSLKDVVFVDYDGEIVKQYTATEFLALSALPANPSHTGLIAQGWNWTLADAKEYVQNYGCLCIGQNYKTSDGKTRIYLDFTDQNTVGRPLYIILCTTVKGGVTIDWGDGASTTTTANANVSGTYSHTYTAGRYTLTLECTSGTYYLGYNGSNHGIFHVNGTPESDISATAVIAMEVGDNVTVLQRQGFGGARNLQTISIPTTLTNFGDTTGNVFAGASSLKCLVFPSGTTAHYGSIASTRFLSVPKSLSALGGLNGGLRMLTLPEADWYTGRNWSLPKAEKIVIPGTYTTLGGGGTSSRCFTGALYCHKFVVPASVTTIKDYALCDNQGLTELHFLSTTVPTLENTRALAAMSSNLVIYVPYSDDHSILAAYQAASNWSTYASKMEEEPQ